MRRWLLLYKDVALIVKRNLFAVGISVGVQPPLKLFFVQCRCPVLESYSNEFVFCFLKSVGKFFFAMPFQGLNVEDSAF